MTPEQLAIFSRNQPGVELIRGAAGSGKTTTALLKLKAQIAAYVSRRRRLDPSSTISVLVLTFNRTLRGYVKELIEGQLIGSPNVQVDIQTFGSWAKDRLGISWIYDGSEQIRNLGQKLSLDSAFLASEVEYLMGRFLQIDLHKYASTRRVGRGTTPRMERVVRERLLAEVVIPYNAWKEQSGHADWNDLALRLAANQVDPLYDIVIADETQDFSANQIRAVMNQLKPDFSATFVLDSTQRIYPRGFSWQEVGLDIRPERSKRLTKNYRNTTEIARVAASIVEGLEVDDDGTIPAPDTCVTTGPKPKLLVGRFSDQMTFAITYIKEMVDLRNESVAFLHPLGGGWFNALRLALQAKNLGFVELSREADWPTGSENIGLSTLHSAKGLEFDHVLILGLNSEVTAHGQEDGDDRLETLRRLLAMGVGRAKRSVVLGYKSGEASGLIDYIDATAVEEIQL